MQRRKRPHTSSAAEPQWYKDAIFYELRVGTFFDSDGDGVGDFRGLTEKLDYLQDLGVTTLWLLPFYPSPFRDDGYDIADFTSVHPDYGTLEDFKAFLRAAHRRGLRVVTELVINHTSDQHPWFQRARRSPPGSRYRDFYVWSDTSDRYADARIIFTDFEPSNWTWDPLARAYYWHRFYSHQPDLNFESEEVRKAIVKSLDFWLGMGVDGLRLDAIPYLYEREGTNCENLDETHEFLRELRAHVDRHYEDRMFLAEANQWPEDAVEYFGSGDECHMAFHFPIMPRLFMAVQMEDRYPIIDIVQQTPDIPESCQWALFLRNHDELTLEMVTDEERDYMYRVYAVDTRARINLGIRRRLAPLLGNDRRRIELMHGLLCSLPGTPVLYYGDEIGMGDNYYLGDRNGVRTPMQWSADRNAGFSRANPQKLFLPVIVDPEYHYESHNVEAQQANRHSLLHWTKRLIALRKSHAAFGRGTTEFLTPANRRVLAFVRRWESDTILVVANLSRFVEYVELDLSEWKGQVAVELFSRRPFPPIGDLPYLLTLGPHAFYWFSIEEPERELHPALVPTQREIPRLRVRGKPDVILRAPGRAALESALPEMLRNRRWFASKAQIIRRASVQDSFDVPTASGRASVLIVEVELQSGDRDAYLVPMMVATGDRAAELSVGLPHAVFAQIAASEDGDGGGAVLYDALEEPAFGEALLAAIERRRSFKGVSGEIAGIPTRAMRELRGAGALHAEPLRVEQSNSSIEYDGRLMMKLARRLTTGTNPELEVGRFLTEQTDFTATAPLAGALEYRRHRHEPATLGVLHGFVANEGDAWSYALDAVRQFFDRALATSLPVARIPAPVDDVVERTDAAPPEIASDLMGAWLESIRVLGLRTAELHLALSSKAENDAFAPEPMGALYVRSLYQSLRNLTSRSFRGLEDRLEQTRQELGDEADALLQDHARVLAAFERVRESRPTAMRIRVHGDYHLGQVLHTGRDFIIIDFEGEPARSLSERRQKRPAMVDVAGMLRSFDYAAHAGLSGHDGSGLIRDEDRSAIEKWSEFWLGWTASAFLRAYLRRADGARFLPSSRAELRWLLGVARLEKCVYELGYELNNRPDWVVIPARGIRRLVEESKDW